MADWSYGDEFKLLEARAALVLQTSLLGVVAAGTLAVSTTNDDLRTVLITVAIALGLPLSFSTYAFMDESHVLLLDPDDDDYDRAVRIYLDGKRWKVRLAVILLTVVVWGTFVLVGGDYALSGA